MFNAALACGRGFDGSDRFRNMAGEGELPVFRFVGYGKVGVAAKLGKNFDEINMLAGKLVDRGACLLRSVGCDAVLVGFAAVEKRASDVHMRAEQLPPFDARLALLQ